MIRMLRTTYLLSVISTPTFEKRDPGGPIRKGTTYIVRPFMAPVKSGVSLAIASAGGIQLLFGPGVRPCSRADEGQVLGARDVVRRAAMQVAAGHLLLIELDQLAAWRRLSAIISSFPLSDPSQIENAVRAASSPRPRRSMCECLGVSMPVCRSSSSILLVTCDDSSSHVLAALKSDGINWCPAGCQCTSTSAPARCRSARETLGLLRRDDRIDAAVGHQHAGAVELRQRVRLERHHRAEQDRPRAARRDAAAASPRRCWRRSRSPSR